MDKLKCQQVRLEAKIMSYGREVITNGLVSEIMCREIKIE